MTDRHPPSSAAVRSRRRVPTYSSPVSWRSTARRIVIASAVMAVAFVVLLELLGWLP